MKIVDINKILKDPKMQDKNTNFKILGNSGGRVTAAFVLQELKNSNALILKEMRTTYASILDEMRTTYASILKEMRKGFAEVNSRIDRLENRIDNLVVKNNLKE